MLLFHFQNQNLSSPSTQLCVKNNDKRDGVCDSIVQWLPGVYLTNSHSWFGCVLTKSQPKQWLRSGLMSVLGLPNTMDQHGHCIRDSNSRFTNI